ncbi:MAG: hypothetical protein KAS39_07385, partial [Actinomycetia bacterium]|nr:hypothetical protein [Actinomycetes bacterium]
IEKEIVNGNLLLNIAFTEKGKSPDYQAGIASKEFMAMPLEMSATYKMKSGKSSLMMFGLIDDNGERIAAVFDGNDYYLDNGSKEERKITVIASAGDEKFRYYHMTIKYSGKRVTFLLNNKKIGAVNITLGEKLRVFIHYAIENNERPDFGFLKISNFTIKTLSENGDTL